MLRPNSENETHVYPTEFGEWAYVWTNSRSVIYRLEKKLGIKPWCSYTSDKLFEVPKSWIKKPLENIQY